MTKKRSKTLAALSSAAMVLPGISAPSIADVPPDNTKITYHYSEYEEDGIEVDQEDVERYDIYINQFQLIAPIADKFSVGVDLQRESMSGASPITTLDSNGEGDYYAFMTGPSIKDDRYDGSVNGRYYQNQGNTGLTLAKSDEDDYESKSITIDSAYNLDNGLSTVSAGISYSEDKLQPTKGNWQTDIEKDEKKSDSVFVGISHIINKQSIIQTGLSYTSHSGYLSDPYKRFGNRHDSRPDKRGQFAWTLGYRQFINKLGALHADYRYYGDDWSVISNTISLKLYYSLNDYLQIVPSFRYYTQKQAEFYSLQTDGIDWPIASNDYRLSSYGARSVGLKIIAKFKPLELLASAERYESRGNWGYFHKTNETAAPGLVDFNRFTFGISYEFE